MEQKINEYMSTLILLVSVKTCLTSGGESKCETVTSRDGSHQAAVLETAPLLGFGIGILTLTGRSRL